MTFAINLRQLRKKHSMSQEELAERLGYKSFTTIQKWESGVSEPSMEKVKAIAEIFGVTIEQLVNGSVGEHMDVNTIGKIIKKARLDMGLTQEELANKVGVQKSAIAKWENGRVSEIKRSNLKALADALNLNPNVLLGESEPHVTVLPKILPSTHAKTPTLALDEQCLVDIYRELNQDGKTALVEYAELISSSDKYKKALSSEPDCG